LERKRADFYIVLAFLLFPAFLQAEIPPPNPVEKESLFPPEYNNLESAKAANSSRLSALVPADSVHDFDVTKYIIEVKLTPSSLTNKFQGHVTVQAKSQITGLNTLSLNFIGMVVDSCRIDSTRTSFTRSNDQLYVSLGKSYNPGSYFIAEVFYHGIPQAGFYFDVNSYGTPVYYSFTEPYDSRYWFPSYDYPNDKARSEVICTAPSGNVAISNGILFRKTNNADGTVTYHWKEQYPIVTYLISLTVSNFAQVDTFCVVDRDTLPVNYWVYPQNLSAARVDFLKTPKMIEFFSGLWSNYPFIGDKYSMAQAELSGAMEHQTCTSWGLPMTGDARYEYIVAHELAHQWWGDWVTCNDFANIWLNEGFASYAEALWQEYEYGPAALRNHLIDFKSSIFASRNGSVKYPIYNPPESYWFGTAVYKKGAWVLHMLRNILGDSLFQHGLAYHGQSHSFGTATTQQFQSTMESYSGQDLDWFFDQWVYSPNYPIYKWSWVYTGSGGRYYLDGEVWQQQSTPTVFKMPVEFKLSFANRDSFFTITDTLRYQEFSMVLNSEPIGMVFDPNYRVLGADSLSRYPHLAGDIDGNAQVLLSDVIYLVNVMFARYPLPSPVAVADVNGDCKLSLSDIIYLVNYFFRLGPPPRMGCP